MLEEVPIAEPHRESADRIDVPSAIANRASRQCRLQRGGVEFLANDGSRTILPATDDETQIANNEMIARVTLEIALRREFDYAIPDELVDRVEVGSRVKVPFGHRQVLGVVTALVESSTHTNLKSIFSVIGAQSLVTPKVLSLARWIGDYYCCPVETALKSVLPEAIRKEEAGWRERLHVHALSVSGELPTLTKRQEAIWRIIEEWRELPLQELLRLGETDGTLGKINS